MTIIFLVILAVPLLFGYWAIHHINMRKKESQTKLTSNDAFKDQETEKPNVELIMRNQDKETTSLNKQSKQNTKVANNNIKNDLDDKTQANQENKEDQKKGHLIK